MLKTAYLNSFVFRRDHFNALRQNFITTICVTNSNVTINLNKKDLFPNEILTIDLNIEIRLNKRKKDLFSNEYLRLI